MKLTRTLITVTVATLLAGTLAIAQTGEPRPAKAAPTGPNAEAPAADAAPAGPARCWTICCRRAS